MTTRRRFMQYSLCASSALLLEAMLPRLVLAQAGMLRRQIPSTGEQLPVIGLGTADSFNVESTPQALKPLADVLDRLFQAGGTVIDTAPSYEKSQGVIGTLLAQQGRAEKAFLATKVEGRESSIEEIQQEMADLKGAPIDLLQVHSMINYKTLLPLLREMKQQKMIRYVGITHHSEMAQDQMIDLVALEPMDFIQINLNPQDTKVEERLLPLCQDKGVAVMINRPFLDGRLFNQVAGKQLPAFASDIGCTSWAQLMIKYSISHPAVTCIIPATSNPAHMAENALAGTGELPDESMRKRIAEYFQ